VATHPLAQSNFPLRLLVVTRSYPELGDLYQYPFVHRRVLAYLAAGHEVAVFRPVDGPDGTHEFEGITCVSGGAGTLAALACDFGPDVIAAHGFSETMWPALAEMGHVPIGAWLHGSEIPALFRQQAEAIADPDKRGAALAQVETRRRFWRDLLNPMPPRLKLVFPSRSAVTMMRVDVGERLRDDDYVVLANPIDTDLFRFEPKSDDLRFRILSIRPFDSTNRANDLSVAAIRHLSTRAGFERLRFTIIGDGPLFDETLSSIRDLENVTLRRQFLTQNAIVEEHARNGIFLVPTRLDTQGVSRDEAMASGLVPVTNSIPTVLEFADESCAGLAPPDDAIGLADALWEISASPALFCRRSAAAADRVRSQSGHERIIPAELALLAEAVNG
jgi:glycosyltransferase involved in cell wall biosynthesis